jgi:nicotinamidase-related amidase
MPVTAVDNTGKEILMPHNPNELTVENSALVLIDHQPGIALLTQSTDKTLLLNNVAALAGVAAALKVPTVLTTIDATSKTAPDPIFREISDVFPHITPIDRSTTNAWSNPDVNAAVKATGRRKLVMAGIQTEVCLAQTVLGALREGYEVFFVSDCSAGATAESHSDAKIRMTMAGARPISWPTCAAGWTALRAERVMRQAIDEGEQGGHPGALGLCLIWACSVSLWCGNLAQAAGHIERLTAHARRYSLRPYEVAAAG